MKVKLIGLSAILLGVVAVAEAQPYYPSYGTARYFQPGPVAEAPGPGTLTREGFGKMLKFLSADRPLAKEEVVAFLRNEIAPYFDFAYMARWAAGPRYSNLSDAQRAELAARIEADFLSTLTQRLLGYSKQQARILPTRRRSANQASVSVAIQNPRGYPARLDFRFHRTDLGWKIYDVSANRSSALMYYRQLFNRNWTATARPALPR
jgi:phospholipid transport system substrate-binding protein